MATLIHYLEFVWHQYPIYTELWSVFTSVSIECVCVHMYIRTCICFLCAERHYSYKAMDVSKTTLLPTYMYMYIPSANYQHHAATYQGSV